MEEKHAPSHTMYGSELKPAEARRLEMQARLLDPGTRRMLERAGIEAGMNVLDVGSGAGDVALLLAELVGPGGTVLAEERNPLLLQTAQARFQQAGFQNVRLLAGDIATVQIDVELDAIVGRLVLMYLSHPAEVLRNLLTHVRDGGVIAFQEMDLARLEMLPSNPANPLYEQVCHWIVAAFRHAGLPLRMGLELYRVFVDAGLPPPHMLSEGVVGARADWLGYNWAAETVRSLLPLLLKFEITSEEEVDIETLGQRMRQGMLAQRVVARGPDMVFAITHKTSPGSGYSDAASLSRITGV